MSETSRGCGCGSARADDADRGAPIACDLSVFDPDERQEHVARTRRLFAALASLEEHADGFSFLFPAGAEIAQEAATWAANEQRCCPFFRFDIAAIDERLRVRVLGPEAAKAILRSGLADLGVVMHGAPESRAKRIEERDP